MLDLRQYLTNITINNLLVPIKDQQDGDGVKYICSIILRMKEYCFVQPSTKLNPKNGESGKEDTNQLRNMQ
jgi:hypothetical protein